MPCELMNVHRLIAGALALSLICTATPVPAFALRAGLEQVVEKQVAKTLGIGGRTAGLEEQKVLSALSNSGEYRAALEASRRRLGLRGDVNAAAHWMASAVSWDQRYVALAHTDGIIRVWDVAKREIIREFNTPKPDGSPEVRHGTELITALALSPDKQGLVSGDASGRIIVWSIADDSYLAWGYVGRLAEKHSIARLIVAEGGYILYGTEDGMVGVFRFGDRPAWVTPSIPVIRNEPLGTLSGAITNLILSPNGPNGQTIIAVSEHGSDKFSVPQPAGLEERVAHYETVAAAQAAHPEIGSTVAVPEGMDGATVVALPRHPANVLAWFFDLPETDRGGLDKVAKLQSAVRATPNGRDIVIQSIQVGDRLSPQAVVLVDTDDRLQAWHDRPVTLVDLRAVTNPQDALHQILVGVVPALAGAPVGRVELRVGQDAAYLFYV